VETVAAALGLALPVVDAYATLYFDVLDRKDDAAYRETAVRAALSRRGRVYDPDDVNPHEVSLLNTGLRGTVQDVMELASRSGCIGYQPSLVHLQSHEATRLPGIRHGVARSNQPVVR